MQGWGGFLMRSTMNAKVKGKLLKAAMLVHDAHGIMIKESGGDTRMQEIEAMLLAAAARTD